ISPDGTRLAFVSGTVVRDQYREIYVRALDTPNATPLSETVGSVSDLFFSPDGQWIGFFSNSKLKKVSVSGGSALTLADAPVDEGGAWAPDGTIAMAIRSTGGLVKVSEAGGMLQELTKLNEDEIRHSWPQFLPDGKTVIFTAALRSGGSRIAAQRID